MRSLWARRVRSRWTRCAFSPFSPLSFLSSDPFLPFLPLPYTYHPPRLLPLLSSWNSPVFPWPKPSPPSTLSVLNYPSTPTASSRNARMSVFSYAVDPAIREETGWWQLGICSILGTRRVCFIRRYVFSLSFCFPSFVLTSFAHAGVFRRDLLCPSPSTVSPISPTHPSLFLETAPEKAVRKPRTSSHRSRRSSLPLIVPDGG